MKKIQSILWLSAALIFFGVCNKATAGVILPSVNASAIQSDGKVVIGGEAVTNYIDRLNANGTSDTNFNPGSGTDDDINAIAIQSDGKIVIGGYFTTYNGTARNYIARLNTNGSLDTSFDPGTGAEWTVRTIAIQSDGKIVIGGSFHTYNGTGRNGIARLNTNGSLDTSFDPGSGTGEYDSVDVAVIQTDGKILIGGDFDTYNGNDRKRIARLNTNGSLDTSFDPGSGTDNYIDVIAIKSSGKIMIGGDFTTYDGTDRNGIARLNSDGSLDANFNPGAGSDGIDAIAIQSDGKIIIGGDFSTYNGTGRNSIARLNSEGTIDSSFNPGTGASYEGDELPASGNIGTIAIQSDGKIIIGGFFDTYNGTAKDDIARINSNGTLDVDFGDTDAVDDVVASPKGDTYDFSQNVTLTSTAGATIYYTTNGTQPTTASTKYSGPIAVSNDTTLKAMAVKSGLPNSQTMTETYKIRPRIKSISSNTPDGNYNAGKTIDIDVNFSEPVTSTGDVTVTLETGTTDRSCTFKITNSTLGTCNYVVQQWDQSSDLKAISISGTIKDVQGNSMTKFEPTKNLDVTKNIVVDAKKPSGSITINNGAASTTSKTVNLKLNATDNIGVYQMRFSNNGAKWTTWKSYSSTFSGWDMTSSTYGGTTTRGTKKVYVQFNDRAGNLSNTFSDSISY